MKTKKLVFLCLLFAVFYTVAWPQLKHMEAQWEDSRDPRPPLDLLFIGNSRTFMNDMPQMVRKIADSAHSAKKYRITMYAPGGKGFEDHWNDDAVQALLGQQWDDVVLQGRSNEQVTAELEDTFQTYGEKLIKRIEGGGAVPVLFVTWRYADSEELYSVMPGLKATLHQRMQQSYRGLAARTGAKLVNVGDAWEKLRVSAPKLNLYQDTNHPGVAGSYLCALMFYRFFSHDDLSHVTYVPQGVSPEDAATLKAAAMVE